MPSLLLMDYLDRCRSVYQLLQHRPAYTAADTARLLAIPPRRFAKVVMVRLDGELSMMVVPAHYRVDLVALNAERGCRQTEMASRRHFRNRFPRCEEGAMPPFGHLFGLRAFSSGLVDDFDIAFKSGTHDETIIMPLAEFQRLAHVEPLSGCARPEGKALSVHGRRRLHDTLSNSARPLPVRHLAQAPHGLGRLAGPG